MTAATSVLQHQNVDPQISLERGLRVAARQYGKGFWAQIGEIWRLQRGPGKLQPYEYYYYRLYDDEKFGFADKQQFVGRSVWNDIYLSCNPHEWWGIAHDKLVFAAAVQGLGSGLNHNQKEYIAARVIASRKVRASLS